MVAIVSSFDPWAEAFAVLGLLWLAYGVLNRSPRFWRLAMGVDGRYSSSRFHGLCWTIVVLGCYTATYCARVHVGGAASEAAVPPNVLTAMGLSLGTSAAAAGMTSRRVALRVEVKTMATESERGLSRLILDDRGHPDLAKAQLLAWTLVALAVYVVASADGVARTMQAAPGATLPPMADIDTSLLILSGVGQGTYLAHKWLSVPGLPDVERAVEGTVGERTPGEHPAGETSAAPAAAGAAPSVPGAGSADSADSAASAPSVSAPGSARVAGFTPSLNGFHFINAFPHEPDFKVPLPGIGSLPIGDASNGVCGGMVYAVRDIFQTSGLAPVAATDPPAPGTPLFSYVVDRLIESYDLAGLGVLRYYEWMITPDGDTGVPPLLVRRGVSWMTIREQWPSIRGELDAGRLCCLGLVTVAGLSPAQLGENHQVLAYGYDVDADANLTLHIYDPNTPPAQADDVRISLCLANPERPTPIAHNVGIALPIRGFFMTKYTYRDPSGALRVN